MVDDGQPAFPANLKTFALRMVELILYVEQHRALDREKNSEVRARAASITNAHFALTMAKF